MGSFDDIATTDPIRIWEGVLARTVEGKQVSLAIVELDPDSIVREHSHENEQLGLVVSGSVTFRIGDETRELGPGGTWQIPPNAPHEVHAGSEGAVVIDVFAPARDDWQALERLPVQSPRWPQGSLSRP
ncbi:MAG: cupin domain-containing protein [Actinomycetota bacterium]|nr:cupin domain-containing protein [Actinomycetota bacterium]MDQ3425617.1 cupin domain-containing protein [Actinomycetota bacterium]